MGTEVKTPPLKYKYFFIIFYATVFLGARTHFGLSMFMNIPNSNWRRQLPFTPSYPNVPKKFHPQNP